MAFAVDSRLAYARLSAVATASRLPTATRGSNNSYTTSWDTTAERLPEPLAVAGLMLAGGGAFMMIDRIQARAKQATPQFTAMAADFLPESLALGGMFAANPEGGVLLALLIGLQNLPEGFNAWHELAAGHLKRRSVLGLMVMLAFLGPVCGLIGWLWLADQDAILGGGDHAVRVRRHSLSHVPGHRAAGAAGTTLGATTRRRAGVRARAPGRDAVPLAARTRQLREKNLPFVVDNPTATLGFSW